MRIANLYDCFERHLLNLDIKSEPEDLFIVKVLEDYILNLLADGISLGNMAEEVYSDLQEEVTEMLKARTYGHYDIDSFRAELRASSGRPDAA